MEKSVEQQFNANSETNKREGSRTDRRDGLLSVAFSLVYGALCDFRFAESSHRTPEAKQVEDS